MAIGYRVPEPTGKLIILMAETRDDLNNRVDAEQEKWRAYCDRNWLNDSGTTYSPEWKVKRFLDSLAYCLLIGNTKNIETDYKKIMHAKREIPVSSCPSYVENAMYAAGGTTEYVDSEERAGFDIMIRELDDKAEKYELAKTRHEHVESKFHKRNRLKINGGEWCRVDTDGVFSYRDHKFQIDASAVQYQPVDTEFGQLYDMDRILAVGEPPEFYDMDYNIVKVRQL